MTPEERAENAYAAVASEVGRRGSEAQVWIIADAIREAVKSEREACARIAEEHTYGFPATASVAATAIRARGGPDIPVEQMPVK